MQADDVGNVSDSPLLEENVVRRRLKPTPSLNPDATPFVRHHYPERIDYYRFLYAVALAILVMGTLQLLVPYIISAATPNLIDALDDYTGVYRELESSSFTRTM
jgi:hypothetical protein